MDVSALLHSISVFAVPVVLAVTLHEAAHGYVARRLGDLTAHAQGRVSLNPLRHVDVLGTVLVPAAVLAATAGSLLFGWAKPVPVNYSALRQPRRDMARVAAAGPAANLAMALVWALLHLGASALPASAAFLAEVAWAGVIVNLLFAALNLLPILPLDGGRIFASLLPQGLAARYARLEPFGLVLVAGLVVLGFATGTVDAFIEAPGLVPRATPL